MADLLAQQDSKVKTVSRGMEVEGEVVAILPADIILDLGTKSEGVLQKKDLSAVQLEKLQVGDKLTAFVQFSENDSGQVVLGVARSNMKGPNAVKFKRFEDAQRNNQVLTGKGLELNKGGLVVEVGGIRGFLPSSQVALAQAANLEELVGKDVTVTVIEVDSAQNRLIFSQKTQVSDEVKEKLSQMKVGDKVTGTVAAILTFGVFVTLKDGPARNALARNASRNDASGSQNAAGGVEGLIHVSELAWEKVEDPNTLYKIGDKIEAKVLSVDSATGRANLSIKQLAEDPFTDKVKDIKVNDIVKATVSKTSSQGLNLTLENGLDGFMPIAKLESGAEYPVGETVTCLVESIDTNKRRVNLAPFITSTKDLIYK